MPFISVTRFVSVVAALCALGSISFGATAAAAPLGSGAKPYGARGFSSVRHETLAVVRTGQARFLAQKPAPTPMTVTLGLSLRHEAQLRAFIAAEDARSVRPLTQGQFDAMYGAPASQVSAVEEWLRAQGLHVGYHSPDGLMITARGTTGEVERAFHTTLNQYRLGHTRFYAATRNPLLPTALGVQTILGLEDFHHATVDVHHAVARRLSIPAPGYIRRGGFWPRDFRVAYDVANHGFYGQGQSLGFTLWGVPVSSGDFAAFHTLTGDPFIGACSTCSTPGYIQWIPVNGASTDRSALGETALDVEYGHGMAPYSHMRYYLAHDNGDSALAVAIAKAANDNSLHVVSNSWGGAFQGAHSSFVIATTNEFEHADAVGTTFYFSSGDNAVYSGCPASNGGAEKVVPCTAVQYPASSPYVVSVGGTNMAMNSSLSAMTVETAWSLANDLSGSGGGCNAQLPRPSWQKGAAVASCGGRAEPDISADGGQDGAANVVVNGQSTPTWGTSLAAPLVAGMAVDTNTYLRASRKALMGWAAPRMYKLANSARYHTYFHDTLCGFNGFPAGPGWDQVTGWGSEDWLQYTKGFAGQSVPSSSANTSLCRNVSSAGQLGVSFSSCTPAVLCWPQPNDSDRAGLVKPSFVDSASTNFLRNLHKVSYASQGFVTGLEETANLDVDNTNAPGIWLASVVKSKGDAVAMVNGVGIFMKSVGVPPLPCFNSTPDCIQFPVFTYRFSDGSEAAVTYSIFSVQNVVGETAVLANPSSAAAAPLSFADQRIGLLWAGIIATDSATNTPLTDTLLSKVEASQAHFHAKSLKLGHSMVPLHSFYRYHLPADAILHRK